MTVVTAIRSCHSTSPHYQEATWNLVQGHFSRAGSCQTITFLPRSSQTLGKDFCIHTTVLICNTTSVMLYILDGEVPPLSVLILSQLSSNSPAVLWDRGYQRILSGRISQFYDPSLELKRQLETDWYFHGHN